MPEATLSQRWRVVRLAGKHWRNVGATLEPPLGYDNALETISLVSPVITGLYQVTGGYYVGLTRSGFPRWPSSSRAPSRDALFLTPSSRANVVRPLIRSASAINHRHAPPTGLKTRCLALGRIVNASTFVQYPAHSAQHNPSLSLDIPRVTCSVCCRRNIVSLSLGPGRQRCEDWQAWCDACLVDGSCCDSIFLSLLHWSRLRRIPAWRGWYCIFENQYGGAGAW